MVVSELEISPNIYYTLDEAARMLRVPRRSVLRLVETGVARGIKIGRHWRILGSDLLAMPRADEDVTDAQQTRSLLALSQPLFTSAWDNDDDSVYDTL
jgi:excisionase family DNA binding protein